MYVCSDDADEVWSSDISEYAPRDTVCVTLPIELEYGVDLTIGPPIEEGFYYDCYMGERTLNEADLPNIKSKVRACVRASLVHARAKGESNKG